MFPKILKLNIGPGQKSLFQEQISQDSNKTIQIHSKMYKKTQQYHFSQNPKYKAVCSFRTLDTNKYSRCVNENLVSKLNLKTAIKRTHCQGNLEVL